MLCSGCYKKIPEGEEIIRQPPSYFVIKRHRQPILENPILGTFCKGCAQSIDKEQVETFRFVSVFFFTIFFLMLGFAIWSEVKRYKGNNKEHTKEAGNEAADDKNSLVFSKHPERSS